MTHVSVVPFALGMAGALLLFLAWLPLAVHESRRPYRWRDRSALVMPREPAPQHLVHVEAPADEPPRHIRPVRVAVVAAAFTVWSLWSLRRRDDPHH